MCYDFKGYYQCREWDFSYRLGINILYLVVFLEGKAYNTAL